MNNQPKSKVKLLGWVLLQLVALSSCYTTYHLSSGEKYRNFFPVKDVHIVSEEELEKNEFRLDAYFHPDTAGIVQYIYPKNITELADSLDKDLLLIFYYPNCSAAVKEVELAKFAEDHNIPYLLISDCYYPKEMMSMSLKFELKNRNQYIIPTINKKEVIARNKRIEFIRKLSPEYYDKMKDDLIFSTVMKVGVSKSLIANPILVGGTRNKGFLIDWIKQEFNIKE